MREFDLGELLIGGMAMEYYGLRQAGADVDFVITAEDYAALARKYPENTQDIFGDKGICRGQFELWVCICLFDYDKLAVDAIEKANYRIISLEKLLFLKAPGIKEPKYQADLQMVVEKILSIQYGKSTLPD